MCWACSTDANHKKPNPSPHFCFQQQVAPFLEELGSYTMIGPALRKRKVDVDHIIASTEQLTVGKLMDQVMFFPLHFA